MVMNVFSGALSAGPIISEFMASNKTVLADDDGSYSDWLEIYNGDETPVSLQGWFLSDNAKKLTKWQIPDVTLEPKSYLIIFASSKDRRDPAKPLHTNFDLSAGGEYLGLVRPDGVTVESEFTPSFPAQSADISYGITQPKDPLEAARFGYFGLPTPGKRNGDSSALNIPASVVFSHASGTFVGKMTLEMTGADAGQLIRYVLISPSAEGAKIVAPTASDPVYTGPLSIDSSVIVAAQIFSSDSSQHGPTASAQYLQVSSTGEKSLADFSSGLPVFILDNHGAGNFIVGADNRSAWLQLFNASTATSSKSLTGGNPVLSLPVEAKIRGQSSALFPKKSFNFTLLDAGERDNAQALLGLSSAADWALVSPWFYDRSYMRNAYVYALGNSIGRWAPRTKFAELFVNTDADGLDSADYTGITLLVERIKVAANRVNITPLASSDTSGSELTGGYILKIDDPSSDSLGWTTERGIPSKAGTVLNVDSVKVDKLAPEQATYIKNYVQAMEDALFADHASAWATRRYRDYIDVPSWVDFHLLNVLTLNVDGMTRSAYFTKDRGGKLVAGPLWDFDRSLGSADGRDANPTGGWGAKDVADPWTVDWWGELARDPDFMQAWIDRWQGLRRNELANENLVGIANSLGSQIDRAAAARDAARWPENRSPSGNGVEGEINHIKDFITQRAGWIDGHFTALPIAEFNARQVVMTPRDGIRIAYTLDGSDPRSSGGQISASATWADGEVTFDFVANPNVRLRAYDPRLVDVFPGSPWSSSAYLAELPRSSRLMNLSSRGYVGAGEDMMFSGVVVRGPDSKRFLARGVGPALTNYGIDDALTQSSIKIYASDGSIVSSNDGWGKSGDAAQLPTISTSVGAFPLSTGSADAAVIVDLLPGSYSLVLSSGSGRPGVGMVELYELGATPTRAVNLSARAHVAEGNKILIGGLAITGTISKRILVRAIGPALKDYAVNQPLSDPVLTVFNSEQAVIAQNDDWQSQADPVEISEAVAAVGAFAFAQGSKDAALVLQLAPGNYTLQVAGKNGESGVGLLEAYELPEK